ncbi:hypothetical protein PhCBS80983_g02240 [Powellomyces hirtus]|uniref:TATA box binding protein associated factor (TAF) histone-like fold domain-containing protein n=1 Tax=Powellomyces hirtus TaxID=109895 RepID=A0A507E6V1_9FUNG|nr:hypothetical protein PhCBS80983_g02240 [Powellomyces hirtus]
MSIFTKDSVTAIADTAGISLKDDVLNAITQDIEYRLREIVHEAGKFMRHSKRQRLISEDINHALRVRNVEPMYGWTSGKSAKFNLITQGTQQIYYVDEQELDLDDILNGPLPPVPLDVTYTAHWLAIEGVQPAIVQNPSAAEIRQENFTVPAHLTAASSTTSTASTLTNGHHSQQPQQSSETLVKTVLTKELQMYYEKITEALTSSSEELRSLAVQSITKDPGIQPLLPYLIQFIAEQVTQNMRKLHITHAMMRLTRAVLDNPNLFVEPYLHQLIPNILTCMVAKRLCDDPASQDHWALRRYASLLVSYICTTYGATYQSLQPRVTKTLLRAFLDPVKPLSTAYGGIVGIKALGEEAVKVLLVPNLIGFGERLAAVMDEMDEEGRAGRKEEAQMCKDAIVEITTTYARQLLAERQAATEAAAAADEDAMLSDPADDVRGEIMDKFGAFAEDVCQALWPSINGSR